MPRHKLDRCAVIAQKVAELKVTKVPPIHWDLSDKSVQDIVDIFVAEKATIHDYNFMLEQPNAIREANPDIRMSKWLTKLRQLDRQASEQVQQIILPF